ncbi:MAG: Flp pilus assembly complex ATPase component TadA [Fimbriimonadaceae bacterium]|nr:Flp pilus assembly complex ATPase component TadA [Fimbriimonadaceae bacterium]
MAQLKQKLGELLTGQRLVTKKQLEEALELQRDTSAPLGSILISMGAITEDLLLRVLAAQMGVAPWHFETQPPQKDVAHVLSPEACDRYQMLPVQKRGDLLTVAMRNPMDTEAIDLARNLSKMRIEPVLANGERLQRAIQITLQTLPARGGKSIDNLVDQAIKEFGRASSGPEEAMLDQADSRPVVGVANQILSDAIRMGSSDVHIEPYANRVEVRYRVDGQLVRVRQMPVDILPMLATRIKIMAELDIVETRMPQDGRVAAEIDGRKVDLRVSVIPNHHGPRIVLRVLDKSVSLKNMADIGFSQRNEATFRSMIQRPYGMILVTGPTGSGKTTTLYSALQEIKTGTNNILTCEDPVEYDIDGIGQAQVNDKIGLSFASLLRSALRQDPDVILVGEIRDKETAETAIRASLTGHLVLSTLHTNDAPGAIPRLLDMGIDPYLLSTSLIGVTAQRLVRCLCSHCKKEETNEADLELLRTISGQEDVSAYSPGTCVKCSRTGYKGRMALHEIMPVVGDVATAIAERVPVDRLRELAHVAGYEEMQADGVRRILQGKTSIQEVRRVANFEVLGSAPQFGGASLRLAA